MINESNISQSAVENKYRQIKHLAQYKNLDDEKIMQIAKQKVISDLSEKELELTSLLSDKKEIKVEGRKNFIDHVKMNELQLALSNVIILRAEEANVILPPEVNQWCIQNNKEQNNKEQKEDVDGESLQNEGSPTGRGKRKTDKVGSDNTGST